MFSRLAVPQGDVQVMCRCREQADNEGVGVPPAGGTARFGPRPTTNEGVVTETQF